MQNLRIKAASETRVIISWETDTERCHVWLLGPRQPDGSTRTEDPLGLDNRIHVNPLQRPDGTYPKRGDKDYFPHRTRDLHAKANLKAWKRIKALIANTDVPALLAAYATAKRAKQEGLARKDRIDALRAAVLLIRQSDGDELAAAMLDEEVAVARWATALRETGADL